MHNYPSESIYNTRKKQLKDLKAILLSRFQIILDDGLSIFDFPHADILLDSFETLFPEKSKTYLKTLLNSDIGKVKYGALKHIKQTPYETYGISWDLAVIQDDLLTPAEFRESLARCKKDGTLATLDKECLYKVAAYDMLCEADEVGCGVCSATIEQYLLD